MGPGTEAHHDGHPLHRMAAEQEGGRPFVSIPMVEEMLSEELKNHDPRGHILSDGIRKAFRIVRIARQSCGESGSSVPAYASRFSTRMVNSGSRREE